MALINIDIHAMPGDEKNSVVFTGHDMTGSRDFGIIVAEQDDVRVSLYLSKELVAKLALSIQDWLRHGETTPQPEGD